MKEDFQHLHPSQHGNFTGRWEGLATKLLTLIRREAKEDTATKLLEDLAPQGFSQQATSNSVLFLLPNIVPPKPMGKASRNMRRWKPSIAESGAAFTDCTKVGTSLVTYMQKKTKECQERGITWQPQVLVLGNSVLIPEQVFVLVNDTVYEVDSLIKAVDVCFKSFFVFNAHYPPHAQEPWLLLQKAVFGIDTTFDAQSARIQEVLGFLRA